MLCSKLAKSHFCRIAVEELLEFQWDGLIGDPKEKAPTLFQVLSAIVVRNDHRRKKTGRAHYPALCTATARQGNVQVAVPGVITAFFFTCRNKVSNTFCVYVSFIISLWSIESSQCECQLLSCTKVSRKSEHIKIPVQKWIEQGIAFTFIGHKIDKKKGYVTHG